MLAFLYNTPILNMIYSRFFPLAYSLIQTRYLHLTQQAHKSETTSIQLWFNIMT